MGLVQEGGQVLGGFQRTLVSVLDGELFAFSAQELCSSLSGLQDTSLIAH